MPAIVTAPDTTTAATVGRRVLASPARLGSTRLVCVDGRAGAGKTRLAADLAGWLRGPGGTEVTTLHLDDCYAGWGGLARVAEQLAAQLIDPLAQNRVAPVANWDWERSRWAGTREVAPCSVLLLEGVGAYSAAYAASVTTLVWVRADPVTRRARALERDGDTFAPWWDAWAATEDALFAREHTGEHADVVVDTTPTGA